MPSESGVSVELWPTVTPQVVTALVRRYGDVGCAEEAAQEADEDDALTLLLLCCHPSLTPESRIALTLRAVGGRTTIEIARAFLVPEAPMAQRIIRAKQRIRESGGAFEMPPAHELPQRLREVPHVLYLVTEGHTASSGEALRRLDLTAEAIRLTSQVHALLPDDGEVTGLLALMLLTEARSPARTTPAGALVPLAEQDRTLWRLPRCRGVARVTDALTRTGGDAQPRGRPRHGRGTGRRSDRARRAGRGQEADAL